MSQQALIGKNIRLAILEPEPAAELITRWENNAEFQHLLDSEPIRFWSPKATKEWLEKASEPGPEEMILFGIYLEGREQPIGFVELSGIKPLHGTTWVGIGLGEEEFWGKGYGTEAMNLLVDYAFDVLGLHRVNLSVFEFNPRAKRSYEKVGFVEEGRLRETIHRDGRRYDIILMGILRPAWEQRVNGNAG